MFGQEQRSFAMLDKLRDEQRELQKRIDQLRGQQQVLNVEGARLEAQTRATVDTAKRLDGTRKAETYRAQIATLEGEVRSCEQQLMAGRQEQAMLCDDYNLAMSERAKLDKAISAMAEGEDRDQALLRLAKLLRVISHYECNQTLRSEAEAIEAGVAERSPYWVAPQPYYLAEGRAVTEDRLAALQERGIRSVTLWGKGSRVLKSEVQKFGVSMEAK